MDPIKLTLDAIFGLGAGYILGNSKIQREAIDIEIQKQLILAKKDQSEKAKELVELANDIRRKRNSHIWNSSIGLSGLYGIMNMAISRNVGAGLDSYCIGLPSVLAGNFAARGLNRLRDRQKYSDLKIIKEVSEGYRSVESLLTEEQVNAIKQTGEKLEESIMSGRDLSEKEFHDSLSSTTEIFDKNPRAYFPLIADWTGNHIKEKINRFFLQKQLKDFYDTPFPEGINAISCGYLGEAGKNKVRLYSRDAGQLNIGNIEWINLELITEDGKNTGIKVSPPVIQIEESTPWTSDYRALAQRVENDKPRGIIMYSSGLIIPDPMKKMMLTQVFSDRYRDYLEAKNKPK